MLKNTGIKFLIFCTISFFSIAMSLSGCIPNFIKWMEEPPYETMYVYSDMPADMIPNSIFNGITTKEDGETVRLKMYANGNFENVDSSTPILVNDYKKYEGQYENRNIAGYFSLAFMTDGNTIEEISNKISNSSGYGTYIIDFNKIFNGFLEGETYKDIGYDLDEKINIELVYSSKNDIYYKMIESQILYELTGISDQYQEDFDNNRELLDNVMNKFKKFSGNEYSKNTIYIVCEQSSDFVSMRKEIYPCYEYYMACEPLYIMYNKDEWNDWEASLKILTEGSYTENIASTARFRTPMDTRHSNAELNGTYKNSRSLDSINRITRNAKA